MPESVKRRGSSGPTIGAMKRWSSASRGTGARRRPVAWRRPPGRLIRPVGRQGQGYGGGRSWRPEGPATISPKVRPGRGVKDVIGISDELRQQAERAGMPGIATVPSRRRRLMAWRSRLRRASRRLAGEGLLSAFADAYPDAFFVEIGANDGEQWDHLRPFILTHAWRGVMVEPLPQAFERLRRNYDGIDRVALENAAIADHDGRMAIYPRARPGRRCPTGTTVSARSHARRCFGMLTSFPSWSAGSIARTSRV